MQQPVLYVAAVPEELGDLPGGEALGVGMVMAGIAMAELLATRAARGALPSQVVLVGTAGAYPDGTGAPRAPLGSVAAAGSVALASASAVTGRGYVPRAPAPLGLRTPPEVPALRVACATAITTDPAAARALAEQADLEHMELFGVALACARASVPLTALLGVTNLVGPGAHAAWRTHRDAAEAAARAVARQLAMG